MPGRFPCDNDRHTVDAKRTAEAAFRRANTKPIEGPAPKPVIPGAKELVSIRIDQDVLEPFQADGPWWQERINAALEGGGGAVTWAV